MWLMKKYIIHAMQCNTTYSQCYYTTKCAVDHDTSISITANIHVMW